MILALYILIALFVVGGLLYILHRRQPSNDPNLQENPIDEQAEEEQCCGMHITCEKDSLLASVSNNIEYYDDEELDDYRGRGAQDYSEEEIEQFRDVLLTLLPEDIAGWGRSLQLRGINLPLPVREELLMIVSEEREKHKN